LGREPACRSPPRARVPTRLQAYSLRRTRFAARPAGAYFQCAKVGGPGYADFISLGVGAFALRGT